MASNPARKAVVTGAASGIGRACVERLRAGGLAVTGVDLADGADVRVDVSDRTAVLAALAGIEADVLVNVAGIGSRERPLLATTEDEWEQTLRVNVTGMIWTAQALVPGMISRGWGRVINMSSVAARDPNENMSPYSASKAAVIALTRSFAKEVARTGVLVNAVAPAMVDTPLNARTTAEMRARLADKIPLGRMGTATEVAAMIAWLCSDELTFSTGAVFDLSGGRATC